MVDLNILLNIVKSRYQLFPIDTSAYDNLKYLKRFFASPANLVTDAETKKEKALYYIDGLLENGGPSTDVFVKGIGKERTAELFHRILFGL